MLDVRAVDRVLAPTPLIEPAELLTLAEAVTFLGVSKPTMYRLLERGDVKGLKVGNQWRFRKSDLDAYLERGPVSVMLSTVPANALFEELAFIAGELRRYYIELDGIGGLGADTNERNVAALASGIVQLAICMKATDIHLEPVNLGEYHFALLRFRIDGLLHDVRHLPIPLYQPLLVHFKNISGMNVEERNRPQEGRANRHHQGQEYDLRLSSLLTAAGEALAIRVIPQSSLLLGLDRLGLSAEDLGRMRQWVRRPSGMVIVTGPAGAGTATLMYSCLQEVAKRELKSMVLDEAGKMLLPWTTPVQVNPTVGNSYPVALHAALRHDPDLVAIADGRDRETLHQALHAALLGRTVFTAMPGDHAAAGAVRMVEMGFEPYLVASGLVGVTAQRLVRTLCAHCRRPADIPPHIHAQLRQWAAAGGYTIPDDAVFYRAVGCEKCTNRGYAGRIGIFELLEFTPAVKEAFLRGASREELTAVAVRDGMRTLAADGIRIAVDGRTTIGEVLRVVVA